MANKLTFEVIVSEKGMKLVQKDMDKLGSSINETTKHKKKASAATDELNYKLNQGTIGTSSAARSFSKLSQAIGTGPNGLVGAYATLAANTFAVVAAFSALREAAQVEQILRGIEVQGAKTGRTLTIAAKQLQETTGFALSAAESYKAVAQVTAAGFGTDELEKLGNVATDAALALGRSVPDAMERITRGVTKLEPELLDELGLMTKLTEATKAYALQTNKSEASLSSFERRQAFLNAIVAEGELKFRGIKDEIGTNPYDKLAASFDNLVKKMFNAINVVGKFLANIGALNEGALFGGLVLFASTISRQVLPSLYTMSETAIASRDALIEQAKGAKIAADMSVEQAKKQQAATLATERNLKVTDRFPAKFKAVAESFRTGTATAQDFDTEIRRLNSSIRAHTAQLNNGYFGADKTRADKEATIKSITETRDQLEKLKQTEASLASKVITSTEESIKARQRQNVMLKTAQAQDTRAQAIALAGNREIGASWKALSQSVKEYTIALALARKAESGVGTLTVLDKAKVGFFAMGTAIRATTAALLGSLHYIGLMVVAISLLKDAYKAMFETDADRERAKALENFNEVVKSTDEKIKQLSKTQNSAAAVAAVTTQALVAQSNAITELGNAALEATKIFEDKIKSEASDSGVPSLFKALFGDSKDAASYLSGIARESDFVKPIEKKIEQQRQMNKSSLGGLTGTLTDAVWGDFLAGLSTVDEEQSQVLKSLDQMSKLLDKDVYDSFVKAAGGVDRLANNPGLQKEFLSRAVDYYKDLASGVKAVEESFKAAETASAQFINGTSESTRYDGMLKAFQSINNSVTDLKYNLTVDDSEFVKVLSGIGADTQRFLTPANQKLLDQVKIQGQIVQQIKAQREAGLELSDAQIRQEKTAKNALASYRSQADVLTQNLQSVEDNFRLMQQQERLAKMRIQQVQAILNSNRQAYAEGGAALKAQLQREEQIRNIQIEQNNGQIAINKLLLSNLEATLRKLELEKKITEEAALQARAWAEAGELRTLELARQANIAESKLFDPATYIAGAKDQEKALLMALDSFRKGKDFAEEQLGILRDIKNTRNTMVDIEDSIKSLQAANNAIAEANLTSEQKLARIAQARLILQQKIQDVNDSNITSIEKLKRLHEELSDITTGASKGALYGINQIIRDTKEGILAVKRQAQKDVAALNQQISVLEADRNAQIAKGNQLEVDALNEQIRAQQLLVSNRILDKDLQISILETQERMKLLEFAIIDIRTEGLEIQKEALATQEAYIDAQSKLLSQTQALRRLNAENAAAKYNTSLSDRASKSLDYRDALEQLNIAKQQFSLKKMGIELEYDILEARRILLMQELDGKRKILEQEAALGGDKAQVLQVMADQMSAAIDSIGAKSYEEIKRLAVSSAERELDVLQAQTEKAKLALLNESRPTTLVTKILGALESSKVVLGNTVSSSITEAANKQAEVIKPVVASQDLLRGSMDILNGSVVELSSELSDYIKRVEANKPDQGVVETLGPKVSLSPREAIMVAADYARSQGLNGGIRLAVEELKGVTKVGHHEGRGHYEGRAFDLNAVGPGGQRYVEASNKYLGAVFDKIAQYYRDMGATVLWRTKGHFNHMHVEFKKAVEMAEKGTTIAAPSNEPEPITVTANRQAMDLSGPLVDTKNAASEIVDFGIPRVKQSIADMFLASYDAAKPFLDEMRSLGPDGALVATITEGVYAMSAAFKFFSEDIKENGASIENVAMIASAALSTISSITAASADAKIANIDREIAAEQKRDGKSAESIAKLKAFEKQKDIIAKKQFDMNKKLSMAQAVIATATGVAQALSYGPIAGPILAGVIAAMGAAQLALIAGTSYQSSASNVDSASTPAALTIGKRGDSIDLARGASYNAGGEIGYLRGDRGIGTSADNYRTIGSAYGGNPFRGYGNRGFVVGEKGPEVLNPEVPVTVTPNSESNNQTPQPVNFNISAIDAKGVKEMLFDQRGNLAQMLRDMSNEKGERFMENVDLSVYTRPNVSKL